MIRVRGILTNSVDYLKFCRNATPHNNIMCGQRILWQFLQDKKGFKLSSEHREEQEKKYLKISDSLPLKEEHPTWRHAYEIVEVHMPQLPSFPSVLGSSFQQVCSVHIFQGNHLQTWASPPHFPLTRTLVSRTPQCPWILQVVYFSGLAMDSLSS